MSLLLVLSQCARPLPHCEVRSGLQPRRNGLDAVVAAIIFLANPYGTRAGQQGLISLPVPGSRALFSFVINYLLFIDHYPARSFLRPVAAVNPWLADLYGAIIMTIVSTLSCNKGPRPKTARTHGSPRRAPRHPKLELASRCYNVCRDP